MVSPRSPLLPARRRPFPAAVFLLFLLLVASSVHGAELVPVPVGSYFPVALDAYDPGQNVFDANYDLLLAPTADGDLLAVWVRWADVDGSQNEVVGRRFDAQHQPLGARFRINAETEGWQQNPAMAHRGGKVLVGWRSDAGADQTVHARLLDDRGETLAPDVEIAESGFPPVVALAPSGRGLVVFTTYSAGKWAIYAVPLSGQGQPSGAPVPVTDFPPGSTKSDPDVGADGTGRFLVVWRSWQQAGPGAGIYGRWFGPSGVAAGPEFQIHQQEIPSMGNPRVAVAEDGSAVVVWDVCNFHDASFPCEVRARTYAADGLPRGPEMRVSPLGERGHDNPAVALDAAGNWAVSFESCRTGESNVVAFLYDCRLTTVFFDRDDRPLGEPQVVTVDGTPLAPSVTAVGDGFLLGWDVVRCDSVRCGAEPEGTYALRYRLVASDQEPPPPPAGGPIASTSVPGFRFWVRIGGEGSAIPARAEVACIPETLCVSGAVPGRSELFLRIVGPKPNGYLWPTIVKFTTSEVEVWIEQESTGQRRYYQLEGASPGSSELPGFFDRTGFQP